MKFTNASEWFQHLPDCWASRAFFVRDLILSSSPTMKERLRYNLPFYGHHSWLCYLIIPNGGQHKDRLVLAFLNGRQLADPDGLLAITEHKLIRRYVVPEPGERSDEGGLRGLLQEALLVNEWMKKKPR